ncbi:hypothetical protein BDN71DRAFT_938321 [Pleurotus eryngii]|uniref:Uncharacterized protein n=1 Tax=Pleurotus eryngii TaxID=5323 RepID=A0A9P5ZFU5_PLEER|nr:hypothetical protein BDN71DRAFT_938321 [Pleurotus eryngii]
MPTTAPSACQFPHRRPAALSALKPSRHLRERRHLLAVVPELHGCGTSNDCTVCVPKTFAFNGGCVRTSVDGEREGSSSIADNNKGSCDACPAKRSACRIPNYDLASMVGSCSARRAYTGFVPLERTVHRFVPPRSVVSSRDKFSCIPCDSSCTSCTGDPKFCLSCSGGASALPAR